ncbi:MarR family winged helix-turn-helix transcriptional regulator [Glaciihabitans arcticus]|nr:MarR family winged helix-turn-helix transcriptional regulator [Glaciihabitans arcticus]
MTYVALFTELTRAEIELWNSLDNHLSAEVQLTLARFQALDAIDLIGSGARVQDVSERMSITVGATSKLVDRLERAGLAARESNPTDRRSSIIVLTPAGSSSLESARSIAEDHIASVLGAAIPKARAIALTSELSSLRGAL